MERGRHPVNVTCFHLLIIKNQATGFPPNEVFPSDVLSPLFSERWDESRSMWLIPGPSNGTAGQLES